MKKFILLAAIITGILNLGLNAADSQENPTDSLEIPFRNSDGDRHVKVHLIKGGVTVIGYEGDTVLVEAKRRSHKKKIKDKSDGLRLLEIPSTGLYAEEKDNYVSIGSRYHNVTVDIHVKVPYETSLELTCHNKGNVKVEGVTGEIDATNHNGSVDILDCSGVVVAHSSNGGVRVELNEVVPDKPMSFTTMNGVVDVSIPEDTQAKLKMNTFNGEVRTDFDIEVIPNDNRLKVEDARSSKGRYRLEFEDGILGTINGGGPLFTFKTHNGDIKITKRMEAE